MSRVQFYSCLKLIAAYQATVPLRQELISSTIALPLPKFSWTNSPTQSIEARAEQLNGRGSTSSSSTANVEDTLWRKASRCSPNLIHLAAAGRDATQSDALTNSDIPSTDSEVEHTDGTNGKERSVSIFRKLLFILLTFETFEIASKWFTGSMEHGQRQPNAYKQRYRTTVGQKYALARAFL